MLVRYGPKVTNQPRVPRRVTARSLFLLSSGIVRKCGKESMMARIRKRMVKLGGCPSSTGGLHKWGFGLLARALDGGCDSDFWRSRDR